jgi:hypothetical protein
MLVSSSHNKVEIADCVGGCLRLLNLTTHGLAAGCCRTENMETRIGWADGVMGWP